MLPDTPLTPVPPPPQTLPGLLVLPLHHVPEVPSLKPPELLLFFAAI
jgi:hypothetical protein